MDSLNNDNFLSCEPRPDLYRASAPAEMRAIAMNIRLQTCLVSLSKNVRYSFRLPVAAL